MSLDILDYHLNEDPKNLGKTILTLTLNAEETDRISLGKPLDAIRFVKIMHTLNHISHFAWSVPGIAGFIDGGYRFFSSTSQRDYFGGVLGATEVICSIGYIIHPIDNWKLETSRLSKIQEDLRKRVDQNFGNKDEAITS